MTFSNSYRICEEKRLLAEQIVDLASLLATGQPTNSFQHFLDDLCDSECHQSVAPFLALIDLDSDDDQDCIDALINGIAEPGLLVQLHTPSPDWDTLNPWGCIRTTWVHAKSLDEAYQLGAAWVDSLHSAEEVQPAAL